MLAILKERRSITECDHWYHFECPDLASAARPGQFVEIKVAEGPDPFLRRPISIFSADNTHFTLLVRTYGRGTAFMERWKPGTAVDVIGPLGNGFEWEQEDGSMLLVGGGIGVAPLNFLAQKLAEENRRVRILFSPLREKALTDCFYADPKINLFFSENRRQMPQILNTLLEEPVDRIFACGPKGMMKLVVDSAAAKSVPTQISMEENMACGIGICVGCAVPIRSAGGFIYKKVCKDGPVFAGEELIFDE